MSSDFNCFTIPVLVIQQTDPINTMCAKISANGKQDIMKHVIIADQYFVLLISSISKTLNRDRDRFKRTHILKMWTL